MLAMLHATRSGSRVHNERVGTHLALQELLAKATTMITNIFNATTVPVLNEVIGFTQARQNVLAGNMANYGTPGYQGT